MADIQFARQFLTTLSSRPSIISSTHVENPTSYPARGAPTLPHTNLPLPKKRKRSAPSASSTIKIQLTSARNPPLSITTEQKPDVSVLELKNVVSEEASIPVAKIKVLCNKKPVPDSKTVSELVGEDGGQLELGLMILGGAASIVPREPAATKAPTQEKKEEVPTRAMEDVKMVDSPGPDSEKVQPAEPQVCGRGVLSSEEFWNDLHGFLLQRLKDESMADDLTKKFRGAI